MITFAWRAVFDPDEERELRDMLAEAAEADAEAGFPQVSLDQPYGVGASHLLVWLLVDDRPGSQASGEPSLAAYLRVEPDPDGGPATARYVVRPAFRSRGISTLLAERLGLPASTGSYHAKLLRQAGVTRARAAGKVIQPLPAGRRVLERLRRLGQTGRALVDGADRAHDRVPVGDALRQQRGHGAGRGLLGGRRGGRAGLGGLLAGGRLARGGR